MIETAPASGTAFDLLRRFREARLWVAGDLMLDEYHDGDVGRISPEAPVPVVTVRRTFHRLGGAANVAHCLAALGAKVSLCGVVGADAAGEILLGLCVAAGIDVRAVRTVAGRQTTRKQRVLSQNQHLLRMDWETVDPIEESVSLESLQALFEGAPPDALVISDYAKGVCTDFMLRQLIDRTRAHNVPILVDPKRNHYEAYRGASYITPNHKELADVLGAPIPAQPAQIAEVSRSLIEQYGLTGLVVTLGERGLITLDASGEFDWFRSNAREVFDVTGAGDTVMAVVALGVAANLPLPQAARIANVAAGIVVGKVGTAIVEPAELAKALTALSPRKVLSRAEMATQAEGWRLQGKRVVFTNGCFDLLHVGHLELLKQAAAHGDVLIVGINSDASVTRLKGPQRPLVPEAERAAMLAALHCVDGVVTFDEDTPLEVIKEVRPHVLVKGADYRVDQVVGRAEVEANGGEVALVSLVENHSTSALVDRIRRTGS